MKQSSDLQKMMILVSQSSDTYECLGNLITTYEHGYFREYSLIHRKYVEPMFDSLYGINDNFSVDSSYIAFKNKRLKEISIFDVESNELVAANISADNIKIISSRFVQVTTNDLHGVYDLITKSIVIPCKYRVIRFYSDSFVCIEKQSGLYHHYLCDTSGQVLLGDNNYTSSKEIYCIFKNSVYSLYSLKVEDGIDPRYSLILVRDGQQFFLTGDCFIDGFGTYDQLSKWYMCKHAYCLANGWICILMYKENELIGPWHSTENMEAIKSLYSVIDEQMETTHHVYGTTFINEYNSSYHTDICVSRCCWGLYKLNSNNTLEMLLHHKYDTIKLREDGLLDVRIGKSWGLATEEGEITAIKYASPITSPHVNDSNTNLCGFLSEDYRTVLIPTQYQSIKYAGFCDRPIALGKYGVPQCTQPGSYDGVMETQDRYSICEIKYAIIDNNFKKVTDYVYDKVLFYEPKNIIVAVLETEDKFKVDLYSVDGFLNPENVTKEEREEMVEMYLQY